MERIVIEKANALSRLGHDITIITTDQLNRAPFFKIDPNVKCVDLNINYDAIEKLSFVKKLIRRHIKIRQHKAALNRLCIQERYDIIISTFGNEIGFIKSLAGVKIKIAEIHFNREFRTLFAQSKFRELVNKWLVRYNEIKARKLDAFICLTNEDSLQWKGIPNLFVIPNFIERKAKKPASLQNKRVIAVGRLNYQKGYDIMLKSWEIVAQSHPDWHLDIYGGGELRQQLIELRDKLGLNDSVTFHEPTSDIYSKMTESSIYCMTSRFEGLPMVLLEAMGCGLPIVSFDCHCGPKDLLSGNDAGILVPFGDVNQMAQSLNKMISDEDMRRKAGEASYKEADKYLIDNIITKWEKLFNNLITNR